MAVDVVSDKTIEIVKFLESRRTTHDAHTNVIKITIPRNGGHFERRAAIGRRNMPRHSTSLYNAHSKQVPAGVRNVV